MDVQKILEQLSLQGKKREGVLAKIYDVVESWGLRLPDVKPDPLHFGLDDFDNIGETEFNVNNNIDDGYYGKFMFMFSGQTCPMHYHRIKHETFFIVKGRIGMELNGETSVMSQGASLAIDQNSKHRFTALEDSLWRAPQNLIHLL
jgi:N-acetylneuraminate synthase